MFKRFVGLSGVFVCFLMGSGLRAQSVFYSNVLDDNNYFPAGAEVAMPIAFTGSYEVDSFDFGYFLPLNSAHGKTTDVIVNFYSAAPNNGDAFSGYDPVQQYYPNLLSSTRITNLAADAVGQTSTVHYDLTPFGDFFQWDAMTLATGETGGWVSLEFTNPDAGWELARGDSKNDVFQDMSNGNYVDFGGSPQAAGHIKIAGQQLAAVTPEPGALSLLAVLLTPGGLLYLRRRNRRR